MATTSAAEWAWPVRCGTLTVRLVDELKAFMTSTSERAGNVDTAVLTEDVTGTLQTLVNV